MIAWLATKLAGMGTKLAVIGGLIVAGLLAILRMQRKAEEAGGAKERARTAEAGLKEARDANQARNSVGTSDADVERMLKPPGARD